MGASKIARDITERKRAEAELRRANKDLEQFAYSASHDLQEPLRTIKIYSELLSDELSGTVDGESAEYLAFLRSGATRMENLVRDLLAYTQVTKIEAPLDLLDANEALGEATANLGGAIAGERRDVKLRQVAFGARAQNPYAAAFSEPDRQRGQVSQRGSQAGHTRRG